MFSTEFWKLENFFENYHEASYDFNFPKNVFYTQKQGNKDTTCDKFTQISCEMKGFQKYLEAELKPSVWMLKENIQSISSTHIVPMEDSLDKKKQGDTTNPSISEFETEKDFAFKMIGLLSKSLMKLKKENQDLKHKLYNWKCTSIKKNNWSSFISKSYMAKNSGLYEKSIDL